VKGKKIPYKEEVDMRIMQISPGQFSPEEIKIRQEYAESLCSPGTIVTVVNLEGPISATDDVSLSLMVPGVLERVREAEEKGYDAAADACFGDPGLEAAKTAVKIPVVGFGESTYHTACLLADKWGLITLTREWVPIFWRRAKVYGVSDRIISIKTVDIPVLEFRSRRDELEKRFVELAKEHVKEGAQLIIAACGAMLPILGVGSRERLTEKLGIMIIDPTATALRVAEMLVGLGIAQSKIAFPLAQ
jgi:allantoin racemase